MFSSRIAATTTRLAKSLLKTRTGVQNGISPGISVIKRAMSADATGAYQFVTLNVTQPREFVIQVELNRPEKRNAMNNQFYSEMIDCFHRISTDPDCRAVVMSGAGLIFTAGIDLTAIAGGLMQEMEPGRKSTFIRRMVFDLQESYNVIEKCPKPVIAAVHNACIGGGVDMISACDIRYCCADAYFQIKEVEIGLAADLGTLQRFPKIVGNESLVRELAFTARKMGADEAKELGFVSRIFPDKESLVSGALDLAELISTKSPVAVQGSKVNLVYARDHSVADGLDYVATWNQSMLQSDDLKKAAMAAIQNEKATFSKL